MANAYARTPKANTVFLNAYLADLSTASSAYVTPGFRGKIKRVTCTSHAATTTANNGITISIGATAVTGGTITVAFSGAAAGDIDYCEPTALNTFSESQFIRIQSDGVGSGTVPATFTLELEPV